MNDGFIPSALLDAYVDKYMESDVPVPVIGVRLAVELFETLLHRAPPHRTSLGTGALAEAGKHDVQVFVALALGFTEDIEERFG